MAMVGYTIITTMHDINDEMNACLWEMDIYIAIVLCTCDSIHNKNDAGNRNDNDPSNNKAACAIPTLMIKLP